MMLPHTSLQEAAYTQLQTPTNSVMDPARFQQVETLPFLLVGRVFLIFFILFLLFFVSAFFFFFFLREAN